VKNPIPEFNGALTQQQMAFVKDLLTAGYEYEMRHKAKKTVTFWLGGKKYGYINSWVNKDKGVIGFTFPHEHMDASPFDDEKKTKEWFENEYKCAADEYVIQHGTNSSTKGKHYLVIIESKVAKEVFGISKEESDLSPTAEPKELDRKVSILLRNGVRRRPRGQENPKRIEFRIDGYYRDALVKAWVLQEAKGLCELCGTEATFVDAFGNPYLEVHHIQPLSEDGPDTIENSVALCPNCHRKCHYSNGAKAIRNRLAEGTTREREE